MKTFIFIFFLLAGQSFWETKGQAAVPVPPPGLECAVKFAKASPDFLRDFLTVLCLVTGKEIKPEDQVPKIQEFADKYKKKADCDLFNILGVSQKDLVDFTADSGVKIASTLLDVSNGLGFTNEIIQLLCNPIDCIKKILEILKDLLNNQVLTDVQCKRDGSLNAFIELLIKLRCLPPIANVGAIPDVVKQHLADAFLKNPLLQTTVQGVTCSNVLNLGKIGV